MSFKKFSPNGVVDSTEQSGMETRRAGVRWAGAVLLLLPAIVFAAQMPLAPGLEGELAGPQGGEGGIQTASIEMPSGKPPFTMYQRPYLYMLQNLDLAEDTAAGFAELNKLVYFAFFTEQGTMQLRQTDGTRNATALIKEFAGGNPETLTVYNNALYLAADGGDGKSVELWKSTGTAAGTVLLKDIHSGTAGSWPEDFFLWGGKLCFTADDGSGRQIWSTDGTVGGTAKLATVPAFTGSPDPLITSLTDGGALFYFIASEGASGRELWKSNGTSAGTTLLKDLDGTHDDLWWGGRALRLDGVNDYAQTSATPAIDIHNQSFSWELWARCESTQESQILYQGDLQSAGGLSISMSAAGIARFGFGQDSLAYSNSSGWPDTWHHWAGTFDSASKALTLYMDGTKVAESTAAAAYAGTGIITVGAAHGNAPFKGWIDEVRIWNVARTAPQIAASYAKRMSGSESGLVACWRFDRVEDLGAGAAGRNDARDFSATGAHLDLARRAHLEPLIPLHFINGALYFAMDDAKLGVGPWKSDGTADGTAAMVTDVAGHPTIVPEIYAATVLASDALQGLMQKLGAGQTGEFTPLSASGTGALHFAESMTQTPSGFLLVNQVDISGMHASRVIKRFDPDTGEYKDTIITSPAQGQPGYFSHGGIVAGPEVSPNTRLYVASGAKVERYNLETNAYLDTFASLTGSHDLRGLAFSPVGSKDLFACDQTDRLIYRFNGATGAAQLPSAMHAWKAQDIGSCPLEGSTQFQNGQVIINASGKDIWYNNDQFHFFFTEVNNFGSITARVDSVTNVGSDGWQKAGIMLRHSLADSSQNHFLEVSPNGNVGWQHRMNEGHSAATLHTFAPAQGPTWVRLTMGSDNSVSAYASTDGVHWTSGGSVKPVVWGDPVYVGLAVTAHLDTAVQTTAAFSNISLTGFNPSFSSNFTAAPVDVAMTSAGDAIAVGTQSAGVQFDGVDDYISVAANNPLKITEDLTLEAWIYMDRNDVMHRILNSGSHIYDLKVFSGGDVAFFHNVGGSSDFVKTFDTNLQAGRWYHLALVRTASTRSLSLYVNGRLFQAVDQAYTGSVVTTGDGSLYFGCMENHNGEFWHGRLRDIRIWNAARSASSIQMGMNYRYAGNETNLVGYWPLDDGTSTQATDLTTNHNHGTLTNSPTWSTQGSIARITPDTNQVFPIFTADLVQPNGVALDPNQTRASVADVSRGVFTYDYMTAAQIDGVSIPFQKALKANPDTYGGAGWATKGLFLDSYKESGFVFEGWFYFDSFVVGDVLFSMRELPSLNEVSASVNSTNGIVIFEIHPYSGVYCWIKSPAPVPLHQWVHLAFRWTGHGTQQFGMLKNGAVWWEQPDQVNTLDIVHASNQLFSIGNASRGQQTYGFHGSMDEIRFWSVSRTNEQIQQGMNAPLSAPQTGLRGYWRFDKLESLGIGDPGINDVRDYSGNGFHLELSSGASLGAPSSLAGLPAYIPGDLWVLNAPGFPAYPAEFTPLGNSIFFAAEAPALGRELWTITQGDSAPKIHVFQDLNKGTFSSAPRGLKEMSGSLLFSADDGHLGHEPWMTDETPDTLRILRDICPGSAGSSSENIRRLGNFAYFAAADGAHGIEPWASDGTNEGTVPFGVIRGTPPGSYPRDYALAGNHIFFSANDGVHGREIWTDGRLGMTPVDHAFLSSARLSQEITGDLFGHALSGVGDINGDGYEDFCIAAPNASTANGDQSGQCLVFFGAVGGPPRDAQGNLDKSKALTILGPAAGDQAGMSVSGAGDFNGDGYSDLLIGVSYADTANVAQNHGEVMVVLGKSSLTPGTTLNLASFSAADGVRITGFDSDNNFTGCSVSGVGNLDGDFNAATGIGIDDIAIGAWGRSQKSGEAYLVYGSTNPGESMDLKQMSNLVVRITGTSLNYKNLGSSISGAGDVNGDGYPDVLLQADSHNLSGVLGAEQVDQAAVFLIYSPKAYLGKDFPDEALDLSQASTPGNAIQWVKITGAMPMPDDNEHSGTMVTAAGDFNRDGYDDILIGSPGTNVDGIPYAGEAYLVYGSPLALGKNGILDLPNMAVELDVNGDGNRDGTIIQGPLTFPSSGPLFNSAFLGMSVSGAGDINWDGFADILIGAPGLSFQGVGPGAARCSNAGAVFVVYGTAANSLGTNGILRLCEAPSSAVSCVIGRQDQATLGWCISSAGDANGDGVADILLGAPAQGTLPMPGEAWMLVGKKASNITTRAYINYIAAGQDQNNTIIEIAPRGDGMVQDGSHCFPFSRVTLQFTGGASPSTTRPASMQVIRTRNVPPEPPPGKNWIPAGVHWNINTQREAKTDLLPKASSTITFQYLESEVEGLDITRLQICQTKDFTATAQSCWRPLPTTVNTQKRTVTVTREHAKGCMEKDIDGTYGLFDIEETYELGQQVAIPCDVDFSKMSPGGPEVTYDLFTTITLPMSGGNRISAAFWHQGFNTLYATAPSERVIVTWKDDKANLVAQQLLRFVWPPEEKIQTFVKGIPSVDLTESGRFATISWRVEDSTLQLNEDLLTSQRKFNVTGGAGRCLLMLNTGGNINLSPVYFLPVRVILWNQSPYFLDNQPHYISKEILDKNYHDDGVGAPYIFFWQKAYYNADPGYYELAEDNTGPTRNGPVIPVNEDLNYACPDCEEDDMVVVFYQKARHLLEGASQKISPSNMPWGWKPVRYICTFDPDAPKIIIASTNGTGDLANYKNPSVYRQPDATKPGFNPNEEHAFELANVVYALRNDLNYIADIPNGPKKTSLPYTLISYTDLASGNPAMLAFKVEVEGDGYTLDYTGDVGSLIQAPMPLSILLPSANYCPNTGNALAPTGSYDATARVVSDKEDRAVVYEDKNHQHWVSAARSDGGVAMLVMRYFYPVQPGFDFPNDANPPGVGACVPWLDKWAEANQNDSDHSVPDSGVPANVTYHVAWPEDAPELRLGETLVKPKYGLPDIADQVSVRVIYQQSNYVSSARASVELGDATRRIGVPLDWAVTDIPADVKWEQRGDKIVFTDLSPLLKPRFWFNPSQRKLYFRGFYVEETTGESYVLPSQMTEKEYQALLHLSSQLSTNSAWQAALNGLRAQAADTVMTVRKFANASQALARPEHSIFGTVASIGNGKITIHPIQTSTRSMKPGAKSYLCYCSHYVYHSCVCNEWSPKEKQPQYYDSLRLVIDSGQVSEIYCSNNTLCASSPTIAGGHFVRFEGGLIWLANPGSDSVAYTLADGAKAIDTNGAPIPLANLAANDFVALTLSTQELSGAPASMTKALSSTGHAAGYVTLAFNDHPDAGALPVSLEVIKVTCPLYQGQIKEIEPDCVFDEKLTLRHTGDLNGKCEDYIYEWRTLPDEGTGGAPTDPYENWLAWNPDNTIPDDDPATDGKQVAGAIDITIGGAGLFTLSDNWFIMRYRKKTAEAGDPVCASQYSDWTNPMLAPGWIKRVMGRIDPFQQRATGGGIQSAEDRFFQYQNQTINTIVSMISEAGKRFAGDVALNCEVLDEFGLIEIYETVLRRGISFSIDALPPTDYPPANHALVLCAGRISDLYMLLGNEAYADALDPTIALGTQHANVGYLITSIFCFMDQTNSLLDEELALLRGRDADPSQMFQVQTAPVYNRFFWNFTQDITGGQVAYALNYDIRDESGDVDGVIDADDAAILYPQGHGDAWGHYLKAIKVYYELMRHPHYTWTPHAEAVLVAGAPVAVNYLHERKFAAVAASKARAGAEIVSLTHRANYSEDPQKQWLGYADDNLDRAWGLHEWAVRSGQGAYFDWLVANAVLPSRDVANEGVRRVDRTTVTELDEISAAFDEIQARMNSSDAGLNPLGLARNAIPFDIEPAMMDPSASFPAFTQFDQISMRATKALTNAVAAFNYANGATQELRTQSDDVADFQQAIRDQEFDYNCRLIEIFGRPYPEDCGPGKLFTADYTGPDYIHYMYVDVPQISGYTVNTDLEVYSIDYDKDDVKDDGDIEKTNITVTYHFDPDTYELTKPSDFTRRPAQGEIQAALNDLVRARFELNEGIRDYDAHIHEIEKQAELIEARNDFTDEVIKIKKGLAAERITLSTAIAVFKTVSLHLQKEAKITQMELGTVLHGVPYSEILGLANGGDLFWAMRLVLSQGFTLTTAGISTAEAVFGSLAEFTGALKESISEGMELEISEKELNYELDKAMFHELEILIKAEEPKRARLLTLAQSVNQSMAKYESALARGLRLLEERARFRQKTAAKVNMYRYKDMAFRIFRNDAVQKYRAQLDLAAMYAYLAAKAYDYETAFQKGDPRGPGSKFMESIVKTRSIGLMSDGEPQMAGISGDPGLADALARLNANWSVIKPQLGINNPQIETAQFSLRSELNRFVPGPDGDAAWIDFLKDSYVVNMLDDPIFRQFCIPPYSVDPNNPSTAAQAEPAFIIPFSTAVIHGRNFFNLPLAAGDSAYDSTKFATKIRSVGVWFSNYNPLGLANTSRVYLIPTGTDIMRSPTGGDNNPFRFFHVVDQAIPVPFALSPHDLETDPSYIPIQNSLNGAYASIRKYGMIRAHHDDGMNPSEVISDSRLVCRSVWNTQWYMIIPLRTMGADPAYVKQRFIYGADGQGGVSDIKIFFYTYAFSGIGKKQSPADAQQPAELKETGAMESLVEPAKE